MYFPPSSSGSSFRPSSSESSDPSTVEQISLYEVNGLRCEEERHRCRIDAAYARSVLDKYSTVTEEWCKVVNLAPSKKDGYIQLSSNRANKFAMLQHVVLWSDGRDFRSGEDCSHLCGNTRCTLPSHIITESSQYNQSRKGCKGWCKCRGCDSITSTCDHEPKCIVYCELYSSYQQFVENVLN